MCLRAGELILGYVDDRTTDPKFGRIGKQKIENIGPLARKRMATFDGKCWAKHSTLWAATAKAINHFYLIQRHCDTHLVSLAEHTSHRDPKRTESSRTKISTLPWPQLPVRPISNRTCSPDTRWRYDL